MRYMKEYNIKEYNFTILKMPNIVKYGVSDRYYSISSTDNNDSIFYCNNAEQFPNLIDILHLYVKKNHDLHVLSKANLDQIKYVNVIISSDVDSSYLSPLAILFLHRNKFKLVKECKTDEGYDELVFRNTNITKIAFHIYFFCIRGTSTAIYDYANYSEKLLGNESIIVAPKSSITENKNVEIALDKFKKRFTIFYYDDMQNLDEILEKEQCDLLYIIKYGTNDGVYSRKTKTCVHCVFDMSDKHGDVYAGVSEQIMNKFNRKLFVPHMVMEPSSSVENLRGVLGIPDDGIVFGYHGGVDSFNIQFAVSAVKKACRVIPNAYFIFVNIPRFDTNPNIFFLNKFVASEDKNKFINTCDCCLEAQQLGQSFGLSLADFSVNNKPIITFGGIVLNDNYKKILGDKALYYTNEGELLEILETFDKNKYIGKDLNCYKEYTPVKVMEQFKKVFIDDRLVRNCH